MKILIAYATTDGQTRKIARFAADKLVELGVSCELLNVEDAEGLDLARFDRVVLADSTLPPLIFVPGHNPSHEQKCLTLAKRLMSGPISERIFITAARPSPLMRVRSTPAQLAKV